MDTGDDLVLAGMGAGRDPDGPIPDHVAEIGELLRIGGRHGRIVFEIADDVDARRTEPGEALAVLAGLDEADRDPRQQRPSGVGRARPGLERTLRHPAVDEHQRDAPAVQRHDGVGPDLGFGDDGEIWLPMRQEALDPARRVEWHVLMHGAGGRRLLSRSAALRVPVVTRTEQPRAIMPSISPTRESASPMLAPCIQTRWPTGRARPGRPRRSDSRTGSSLPRRERHASSPATAGSPR